MRAMFGFTKVRYKERRGSTMQSESFGVVGVEWLRAWDLVRRGALGNRGGQREVTCAWRGFRVRRMEEHCTLKVTTSEALLPPPKTESTSSGHHR